MISGCAWHAQKSSGRSAPFWRSSWRFLLLEWHRCCGESSPESHCLYPEPAVPPGKSLPVLFLLPQLPSGFCICLLLKFCLMARPLFVLAFSFFQLLLSAYVLVVCLIAGDQAGLLVSTCPCRNQPLSIIFLMSLFTNFTGLPTARDIFRKSQ